MSLLEHGIYRNLIDSYYMNEGKLIADDAKLMRTHSIRTDDEKQAYKNIVLDFFIIEDGFYINEGADKILSKIFQKSQKARESAQKRWEKNTKAMRTHSEGNANGMLPINPLPSNPVTQDPIKDIVEQAPKFNFKKELLSLGVDKKHLQDWLEVRKKKKAANTETALKGFLSEVEKSGLSVDQAVKKSAENSWSGFKSSWVFKKTESENSFMKNVKDF